MVSGFVLHKIQFGRCDKKAAMLFGGLLQLFSLSVDIYSKIHTAVSFGMFSLY